jgi:putative peptide zinc metalloprotease protein
MDVHPKFRADLLVLHQNDGYPGNRVVVKDPVSGRYFQLSPYEFQLLRTLDGSVSVEEAVGKLKGEGRYYASADAGAVVAKAAQLGLLLGTGYSTAKHLVPLKDRLSDLKKKRLLSSMYYLFIPVLDPDRFLERTVWIYRLLLNRNVIYLAAVAALGALGLIVAGLPRMSVAYLFFFTWEHLLFLWFTIALTKLVHEFAHAYTAKYFGLRVPEMGVAFLIFFPCLYCNTTDAWELADRKQRVSIGAAGIVAEAALAVIATYVWYFTPPSLINSLAFYQIAISFISTVLFNGNPLLKFDGYFILIDVLGMPNLAGNALKHVKYLFMNRVLGSMRFASPAQNPGEARIYAVYGISSLLYRITLYAAIVTGVYYRFDKFVGIVLAVVAVGLFVLRPLWAGLRTLYLGRSELSPRAGGVAIFGLVSACTLVLLLAPWSSTSVYPCFVASEKVQKLTVPLQTLVTKVYVREGSPVRKGDPLFHLDTTLLLVKLRQVEIERNMISREMHTLLLDEKHMSKAERKEVELRQAEAEAMLLRQRLALAETSGTAPFDGVVTNVDPRLQDGFQPGPAVVIGEVRSPTDLVIHALVPAEDLHKVREGQDVEIWLPIGTGMLLKTKIDSIKPYSETDLRDSPFSSRLGGELATEVLGEKQEDVPLEPQYDCSVRVSNQDGSIPLGMTGRMAVPSRPRSLARRFLEQVFKTFHRESLL